MEGTPEEPKDVSPFPVTLLLHYWLLFLVVCISIVALATFIPAILRLDPFLPMSPLLVSQESPKLFNKEDFLPLDPTQELIFPPELIVSFFLCQPFEKI